MLADIIYTAKGKITHRRIIKLEPLQFEGFYVANGKLRNDREINEYCTYNSIKKGNDITYGEGKHLLVSNNGSITWVGRGFGKQVNDKQIWRGCGIFESKDLTEFNAIVGVVEAVIIGDELEISVWEWK